MLVEFNKALVNKINEPLDPVLIRTKDYGSNKKNAEKYITGYTVVRLLNDITNGAWSWNVDKTWSEEVKDAKGSRTIYYMLGTLTLYFAGPNREIITIQKQAIAGKELYPSVKTAENIYKSIGTLALRKAASYAGVGAELWLNEDETDYFETANMEPVWTDELKAQYKEQWSFIDAITKEYESLDKAAWNSLASDFGYPGLDYIPTDRIDDFIEYIKTMIASQEES